VSSWFARYSDQNKATTNRLLWWGGVAVTLFLVVSMRDQSKIRTLGYGFGAPIVDRLLPGDEIVVVNRVYDSPAYDRMPSANEFIEDLARRSTLVAEVDLDASSAMFVEDGDWIRTRLMGTVRRILGGAAARQFAPGQSVSMQIEGGELYAGHVLIKALPSELPLHRTYIWFVDQSSALFPGSPPTTVSRALFAPLRLENGRVLDSWVKNRKKGDIVSIDRLGVRDVEHAIGQASK
jgi:hypothetical protein